MADVARSICPRIGPGQVCISVAGKCHQTGNALTILYVLLSFHGKVLPGMRSNQSSDVKQQWKWAKPINHFLAKKATGA